MVLGFLCLGLTLTAQSGIVNTRQANPQDGKVLTMEETILSSELSPANLRCTWNGNGQLMIHKDGKWQSYDVATGTTQEYRPAASRKMSAYTKDRQGW